MKTLKMTYFGPIKEVEVELGDITILVGPQATGKSLFLQFLSLVLDWGGLSEFSSNIVDVVSGLPQSRYAKKLAESGISIPRKVTPYLDTQVEYI